jgi:hypothetical protein
MVIDFTSGMGYTIHQNRPGSRIMPSERIEEFMVALYTTPLVDSISAKPDKNTRNYGSLPGVFGPLVSSRLCKGVPR